jgi:hypothetical protein
MRPSAAFCPLIAQLTGCCAVTVASSACVDRSRYADLGGAIAAPVSLAAIALARRTPITSRFLVEPPATAHGATIAWYFITAAALTLSCAAMRDRWQPLHAQSLAQSVGNWLRWTLAQHPGHMQTDEDGSARYAI